MAYELHQNKNYIHHQNSRIVSVFREIIFGMEDGMVSTLGAITGIAAGSRNHFVVLLAGFVIISVESISMGIGSYLSNKSESEIIARKLSEEENEINDFPEREKEELKMIYLKAGWSAGLAAKMAEEAGLDKKLMLKEMAYRELDVSPNNDRQTLGRGFFMFFSYVIGGMVPLFAYLILPIASAVYLSVVITLIALFCLGVLTTRYTKRSWLKTGLRMLLLGGVALVVGLAVSRLVNYLNV